MSTKTAHDKKIKSLPRERLLKTVTDVFRALGDITRVKIMYGLQKNELCVSDLADLTAISQSGISHQLSYLRKLRLVTARKDKNTVFYSLSYKHLSAMLNEAEYYADHIKRHLPDHPYRH
jgi:ArsR family transcriptional regulator, lead/cadmium/zinc/bismuth-responsive transcriptional repressor